MIKHFILGILLASFVLSMTLGHAYAMMTFNKNSGKNLSLHKVSVEAYLAPYIAAEHMNSIDQRSFIQKNLQKQPFVVKFVQVGDRYVADYRCTSYFSYDYAGDTKCSSKEVTLIEGKYRVVFPMIKGYKATLTEYVGLHRIQVPLNSTLTISSNNVSFSLVYYPIRFTSRITTHNSFK